MEGAFLNVSTYTVPQYYTVICSYLWLYAAIYGSYHFLDAFEKLRKKLTASSCVRPSVRMENSAPIGRIFKEFDI
jgi:hypothetical protein